MAHWLCKACASESRVWFIFPYFLLLRARYFELSLKMHISYGSLIFLIVVSSEYILCEELV